MEAQSAWLCAVQRPHERRRDHAAALCCDSLVGYHGLWQHGVGVGCTCHAVLHLQVRSGLWMNVASLGDAGTSCLGYFGGSFSPDSSHIVAHGFTGTGRARAPGPLRSPTRARLHRCRLRMRGPACACAGSCARLGCHACLPSLLWQLLQPRQLARSGKGTLLGMGCALRLVPQAGGSTLCPWWQLAGGSTLCPWWQLAMVA